MIQNNKVARISGLLYLVVVITGIFSLAYVPKTLFIWNDSALTFKNIISSEVLFRWSIMSSIICYTAFLFLPLFLYKLLKQVHEFYAQIMAALAIISVPISFVNLQNKLVILSLIDKQEYLNNYSDSDLDLHSKVMFYLNQYNDGILLVTTFWGLWLLPFGYLVYKSNFLPKILGVFLMLGCIGYLVNLSGNILIKNYSEIGISKFVSLPASIGEIGICLWLLIIGTNQKKERNLASH